MRKKIVLLFTLLASMMGVYADDIVEIRDVRNIVEGYTGSFDIVLKESNTNTFTALAIDVQLPTGFIYTGYAKGDLLTADHAVTPSPQDNNTERFSVLSQSATPDFTGTSGVLLTIYFTVGSTSGDVLLKDIKLTLSGNNHFAGNVQQTLTVGNDITLDENETWNPITKEDANLTVKRTLKAGVWNTIVLPFNMNASQIEGAFGTNVVIAELSGVAYTMPQMFQFTGIKFSFTTVSEILANKAYIIKISGSNDLSSFSLTSASLSSTATPEKTTVDDATYGSMLNAEFVGTYTKNFAIPENGLYISNNQFKYTNGTTKLKAYRAYFKGSQTLTDKSLSNASRSISFSVDGEETTGIINLSEGTIEEDSKFYNLKGQSVQAPTKGVYVVNGKKIIIK